MSTRDHCRAELAKLVANTEEFSTGAHRDTRAGKGRYDLISPIALRELALLLEEGAEHYGARNWEKGMPIARCMDSALRHLNQWREGDRSENHLVRALFNTHAMIHTPGMIDRGFLSEDLDDLPNYLTAELAE